MIRSTSSSLILRLTLASSSLSLFVACSQPNKASQPEGPQTKADGPTGGNSDASSDLASSTGDAGTVSPEDAASPGDAATVSGHQACLDFAAAYCNRLDAYAKDAVPVLYGDLATCNTRNLLYCEQSLSVPGTSLTPARWDACAQATAASTGDAFFSNVLLPACAPQAGTLADGNACAFHDQCAGGLCKGPLNSCGICEMKPSVGGSCASDTDCDEGLACSGAKCVAYGTSGASCDGDHPCDATFKCNAGHCEPLSPVGGACATYADCQPWLDCASHVCQMRGVSQPGESCGYVYPGAPWTDCNGTCAITNPWAESGVCVPYVADGAHCDPSHFLECMWPAQCLNSTCTVLDPLSCK